MGVGAHRNYWVWGTPELLGPTRKSPKLSPPRHPPPDLPILYRIREIADTCNKPGKFTTFPGWEWTSTPNNRNLHRNVFFKDSKRAPASQFSSVTSTSPEELWKWMDAERAAGNDVIAIRRC